MDLYSLICLCVLWMVSLHWLRYFSIQLSSSVCGSLRNFAERHVTLWYWFFLALILAWSSSDIQLLYWVAITFLVLWLQNRITDERRSSPLHVCFVQAFAFCALLTMNIDRYLAIAHLLFHKTPVTKSRLLKLMLLLQLLFLFAPILCLHPIPVGAYVISWF